MEGNEEIILNDKEKDAIRKMCKTAHELALQDIVNKLRNYRIDTIQDNGRLHCTCVLKPGE